MKILLLCLLLVPRFALAEGSVYLEDLTWPEVKARVAAGAGTVIIPSGGTEQSGPHMILGKHNRIVAYTSGEIARRLGNALVAPVIAYVPEGEISPPEGHMRFPGTISMSEDHFALLLEDAARSLKQAGFKRICFIGDHGGNQDSQARVAEELSEEWEDEGVVVMQVSDYYAEAAGKAWLKAKYPKIENIDEHGGFMDVSELMAVDAEGIRPELLKHYSPDEAAKTGVMGDPVGANAEDGKKLLEFKINAAVAQIGGTAMPAGR